MEVVLVSLGVELLLVIRIPPELVPLNHAFSIYTIWTTTFTQQNAS